jgi:hypothetical protein
MEDENSFVIELKATDINGDEITYTATSSDELIATVTIIDNNLTITPIADANGMVTIEIDATANGKVDTKSFNLNITALNDAPTLNAITNISKNWINPVTFNDYNGDDLNLTISSIPNQSGITKVTITINDGTVTTTQEFNITVETTTKPVPVAPSSGGSSSGGSSSTSPVAPSNDTVEAGETVAKFDDTIDAALSNDLTPEDFPILTDEELDIAQNRQDFLTNRVSVATYFTDRLGTLTNVSDMDKIEDDPAYIASKKIIQGVSAEESTRLKAEDYIDTVTDNEDAMSKIDNEFKWVDDIILTANEWKICTNSTPFNVKPTDNPLVKFTTGADSKDVNISVDSDSEGLVTIVNCTAKGEGICQL